MVECESDGSKGGEGKVVESHRQGRAVSEGSIGEAKLRLSYREPRRGR